MNLMQKGIYMVGVYVVLNVAGKLLVAGVERITGKSTTKSDEK